MAGPDAQDSRSTLRAAGNGGDPTPYLRYVAARYGSYPNVWFCLCNEYEIKRPSYSEADIVRCGRTLRGFLAHPAPISVHICRQWNRGLNASPPWNDHVIIQKKLRSLPAAADAAIAGHRAGGGDKPLINDELSYQGAGDRHTHDDNLEAHLGAFLGGGYASGSCKPAGKKGQYFWGRFNPAEHTAAKHLKWLRERINAEITFWKMAPVELSDSIFGNTDGDCRAMAWAGREYVLGTNKPRRGITADLPAGTWTIRRLNVATMKAATLCPDARGRFTFDAPDSRAVLFHFRRNQPLREQGAKDAER